VGKRRLDLVRTPDQPPGGAFPISPERLDRLVRLAHKWAWRVSRTFPLYSQDDLAGPALLGLSLALRSFDPGKAEKLFNWATRRIRGEIYEFIRGDDCLPRYQIDRLQRLEWAERNSSQPNSSQLPSRPSLAAALNVSEETLEQWQALRAPWLFYVPEQPPCAFEQLEAQEALRERVAPLLNQLSPRDRAIIHWLYWDELPLTEIAERLALTPTAITHAKNRLLARFQQWFAQGPPKALPRPPSEAEPLFEQLPERHRVVLTLLDAGVTKRAIARALKRTPVTITSYVKQAERAFDQLKEAANGAS